MYKNNQIADFDPELFQAVKLETIRQEQHIEFQ